MVVYCILIFFIYVCNNISLTLEIQTEAKNFRNIWHLSQHCLYTAVFIHMWHPFCSLLFWWWKWTQLPCLFLYFSAHLSWRATVSLSPIPSFSSSYWRLTASFQSHNPPYSLLSPLLVRGELILTLLLNVSVSLPEPTFLPENFKKKDVVEILSHKKAYNACEYE